MAFNKAKAMEEAEKLVVQGKVSQAIKQYAQIRERDPSDLTLLNTIGDLYVREKNIPRALEHFRELADAYVQEGFTVKAIAIYRKIAKLEPGSVDPILKLAELYIVQGLSREAREHYAQAVEFYKKKKQSEKALEVFRKMVALEPENPTARVRLAEFCEHLGKAAEATAAYLEAGEVALRRGDLAAAELALKKAAQTDPRNEQVHLLRARLAFSKQDLGEVERILESFPGLKAGAAGRQLLLEAYLAGRKLEAAEKLVLEVYHSNPQDFRPLASYSALCVEKGNFDAAWRPLAAVADALLEQKNTGPLMDSLRRIWMKSPQHIPTLELIHRVCERTGDEFTLPEILEALGHAYVQGDQLEKAETIYRKFLAREPENEHLKELLRQVLEKQGKEVAVPAVELAGVEMALAPEAAAAPVEVAPAVDTEQAAMVKEALENSDLFSRYGLLDKAVAELEKVLAVYPEQLDIHKRILEICHRSRPERATEAAQTLAQIYTKSGDPATAKKYEDLVKGVAVAPPVEEFELPAAVPEAEAFAPAAAPERTPGGIDLSAVFPTAAPEPLPVEAPPPVQPGMAAPQVEAHVLDLSSELEAFAKPAEIPLVEAEVPGFSYEESRTEIDFYLEQGFFEEARQAIRGLEEKFPGSARVAELRQQVELRAVPAEKAPEAAPVEEVIAAAKAREEEVVPPVEAAEWELPSAFVQPAVTEAAPAVVEEVKAALAPGVPLVPPAVVAPAAAEAQAAGGDLLGSLVGELAASLEGMEGPPAPTPTIAERVPAAGAEGVSPLSGLLEEFSAGVEAPAAAEDVETHYNLGVAFREMGLLDEAIGEFQKVVKGAQKGKYPPNFLQACSLLAVCFMDKAMPAIAVKWYNRALEAPDLDEEAALALHYDLGVAYEKAGDTRSALEKFSEVYSQNIDYRDVAEKIRLLQPKAP